MQTEVPTLSEKPLLDVLERVLTESPHGHPFSLLRRRVGFNNRIHKIAIEVQNLARLDKLAVDHRIYWTLKNGIPVSSLKMPVPASQPSSLNRPQIIGDQALIGPVWEPKFAQQLWQKGLRIIQQYPAQGYYLDIALIAEDNSVRLDIEVDGRSTHCDRHGRRKVSDIIRDVRLIAAGWSVKRFWVSELMRDMEGCVVQVEELWKALGKGG